MKRIDLPIDDNLNFQFRKWTKVGNYYVTTCKDGDFFECMLRDKEELETEEYAILLIEPRLDLDPKILHEELCSIAELLEEFRSYESDSTDERGDEGD